MAATSLFGTRDGGSPERHWIEPYISASKASACNGSSRHRLRDVTRNRKVRDKCTRQGLLKNLSFFETGSLQKLLNVELNWIISRLWPKTRPWTEGPYCLRNIARNRKARRWHSDLTHKTDECLLFQKSLTSEAFCIVSQYVYICKTYQWSNPMWKKLSTVKLIVDFPRKYQEQWNIISYHISPFKAY